jgi:GNAT superfamily N-acetyltransferase
MYESIGRPESGRRIDDDIRSLAEIYGGENGRIILATSHDGNTQTALGVVFLDLKRFPELHEGELRFMWIRPDYRSFGIAPKLMTFGIDLAKKLGCRSLRAEILPEIRDAIALVEKNHFERTTDREPYFTGRLVYVRNL